MPSVLTPTMSPAPVDATFQAQTAAPSLIPQEVGGFFGGLVDFLGTPGVNQGLRTAGEYYLGRENIKDVQRLGREQQ